MIILYITNCGNIADNNRCVIRKFVNGVYNGIQDRKTLANKGPLHCDTYMFKTAREAILQIKRDYKDVVRISDQVVVNLPEYQNDPVDFFDILNSKYIYTAKE